MPNALIVDDHPPLRMVLAMQLRGIPGIGEIHEASNGQDALEIMRRHAPDLVILDLDIPRINGLDLIPRLRAANEGVRILVVSGQDVNTFAARVMQAGAQGFVSKLEDMPRIAKAMESVLAGYTIFPDTAVEAATAPSGRTTSDEELLRSLSDKELLVLQMLARGMTNKAVADSLYISNKTVSTHKTHIMQKLRVGTLVELVDFARRCNVAT